MLLSEHLFEHLPKVPTKEETEHLQNFYTVHSGVQVNGCWKYNFTMIPHVSPLVSVNIFLKGREVTHPLNICFIIITQSVVYSVEWISKTRALIFKHSY